MKLVRVRCMQCHRAFMRAPAQMRNPKRQFCSMKCAGRARRTVKPPKAVRVAMKAQYDREYRKKNLRLLKKKKRAYYLETFDAEKMRAVRKKRSKWHTEYGRRYYADPKRKAFKVRYDKKRQGQLNYAEYGEAWQLLLKLEREIKKRTPSWYERAKARGYYANKKTCQTRKRESNVSKH